MTYDRASDAELDLLRVNRACLHAGDGEVAPALPAFAGLVRAVSDLTRFAIDLVLEPDEGDPLTFTPRILRAA